MTELQSILQQIVGSTTSPGVLATLVSVAGSSYRRPGARLLLTPSGARIGSISGGCLEADILARANQVMATGKADVVTYDTTSENDLVWGVGLGCHGVVRVLIEKLQPSPFWATTVRDNMAADVPTVLEVCWQHSDAAALGTRLKSSAEIADTANAREIFRDEIAAPTRLIIFGAGDDAQPLCRMAKELGWHVTVADPRSQMATTERFPSANIRVVAPAHELLARAGFSASMIAVVMTHRYVHDIPVLKELLTVSQNYVGLLGPKKRAERILADLAESGSTITDAQRERLHAPVGLDLGAETPQEVALSIMAEIQAYLARRDARPLRGRTRPIHGA